MVQNEGDVNKGGGKSSLRIRHKTTIQKGTRAKGENTTR